MAEKSCHLMRLKITFYQSNGAQAWIAFECIAVCNKYPSEQYSHLTNFGFKIRLVIVVWIGFAFFFFQFSQVDVILSWVSQFNFEKMQRSAASFGPNYCSSFCSQVLVLNHKGQMFLERLIIQMKAPNKRWMHWSVFHFEISPLIIRQ